MKENYAFVSLLGTDNYIYAAIALMYSWKNTNSKYPFYLLVTENISEENKKIATAIGFKLIPIQRFVPDHYEELKKDTPLEQLRWHEQDAQGNGWQHAFSKLYIWSLTQFDKVCFIDLDSIILKNIDEIFQYPSISSIHWREDKPFNTALIVVEPNHTIFEQLILFANQYAKPVDNLVLLDDWTIVNQFFSTEASNKITWIPSYLYFDQYWLPKINTELIYIWPSLRAFHMGGLEKPWNCGKKQVRGYNIEWEYLKTLWFYYIDLLNDAIKDINNKQIASLLEIGD